LSEEWLVDKKQAGEQRCWMCWLIDIKLCAVTALKRRGRHRETCLFGKARTQPRGVDLQPRLWELKLVKVFFPWFSASRLRQQWVQHPLVSHSARMCRGCMALLRQNLGHSYLFASVK
jgi:hypothetical protein